MESTKSVVLGGRYRDRVTGFEGTAVAVTEYLNGCRRVSLERLSENGDAIINLVFDEPNLELVLPYGARAALAAARDQTGGPHDHDDLWETHR